MEYLDVVTLEDNQKYAIIDEIKNKENTYIYLTNVDDKSDFCIRKLIGETELVGLDDDKEFDFALMLFTSKHIEDIK